MLVDVNLEAYPKIVSLSALIACNAINWPGGDALSFQTSIVLFISYAIEKMNLAILAFVLLRVWKKLYSGRNRP